MPVPITCIVFGGLLLAGLYWYYFCSSEEKPLEKPYKHDGGGRSDKDRCGICRGADAYKHQRIIRWPGCRHSFHYYCFLKWHKYEDFYRRHCPICFHPCEKY